MVDLYRFDIIAWYSYVYLIGVTSLTNLLWSIDTI